MFDGILQKFADQAPGAVMVRALLEHLLNAERLEAWFERTRGSQYTRKILFSSLVGLLLQVVCKTQASVHAAYRKATITASIVAVYAKLRGVELETSQALVRDIARESARLIDGLQGRRPPLLPGYRIKYLDGNCVEASERRLKALRESAAAALPGKSLVVFDQALDLVDDVFPCADGHAQERALLGAVSATVAAQDLWVADRNFCVLSFLLNIERAGARFIIREHAQFPCKPLEAMRRVGPTPTGTLFEQAVQVTAPSGETFIWRRLQVKLKTKTRNGDSALILVSNLPAEVAAGAVIADIYRTRWTIETAFQKLEAHLHSEINTLGYPEAALFGFCLALVAFNLYAVVMAALRAAHPDVNVDESVSPYYLAAEIANTTTGMNIAVDDVEWTRFARSSHEQMCTFLLDLASRVNLAQWRKSKRGPKKAPTPRTKYKGKPHISTAKVLAGT